MSVILVTHDLGVVAGHTDEIAVMYGGQLVEKAPTPTLFANMKMPYTEALLESIPKLEEPATPGCGRSRPAARPRQPAEGLPVRAPLSVRARPLPRRGAAARAGRRPGPPVRLLVPGRLARVPRAARELEPRSVACGGRRAGDSTEPHARTSPS